MVVKGVSRPMLITKSSERRYNRPAAQTTDVCSSEWERKENVVWGNSLRGRRGDIQEWVLYMERANVRGRLPVSANGQCTVI